MKSAFTRMTLGGNAGVNEDEGKSGAEEERKGWSSQAVSQSGISKGSLINRNSWKG